MSTELAAPTGFYWSSWYLLRKLYDHGGRTDRALYETVLLYAERALFGNQGAWLR